MMPPSWPFLVVFAGGAFLLLGAGEVHATPKSQASAWEEMAVLASAAAFEQYSRFVDS